MRLCSLVSSLLLVATTGYSQNLKHPEILGRPTANSITVHLIFSDSADVRVEFGTVSGIYSGNSAWQTAAPDTAVEIELTGLMTNTLYYYRVSYKIPGTTTITNRPEHSFHTQRSPGNSFTFTIQADPHLDGQSDTNVYIRCLQNQLDDHPDFMIDLGDFLMTDKLKNTSNQIPFDTIPYRCNLLRNYYDKISHSVPLYIVLGNHEGESGWNLDGTANNIAVWGTNERKKYFPNPFPNTFYSGDTTSYPFVGQRAANYSWTWGDALFVVLDPYWHTNTKPDSLHGWNWTLGKEQYDWLRHTLESSNAVFKFVFAHHLVGGATDGRGGIEFADRYEWGGQNADSSNGWNTNRSGWYKPIKDLLTENRVTIFFHGHDHFFGKQDKDCLIYQECPQPSHPNFTNISYATDYGYVNGQILPNSGHVRVSVSPNGVQTQYIRTYLPADETPTRHNKDTSATYYVGAINCYDSIQTTIPVLWNSNYINEVIYPNPFSTLTNIEFTIPTSQEIGIAIYNMNGILVRHLLRIQPVHSGNYTIIWDGKNDAGNLVENGNYIYEMTGENGLKKTSMITCIK